MNIGTLTALLKLDKSDYDKGLDSAEKQADKTGGFISNAFSSAQKALPVLAGGLTVLTGALGAAAFTGLSFNNTMEQSRAKLNAINKDAKVTEEQLAFISEEAAKTPFAFEEMVAAYAGLLPVSKSTGRSMEDLIREAEILAAVNPAQGLEGSLVALRSAAGGDFASAMERFDIPREMIQKLKDEGVPNSEIVGRALQEMGFDMDLVTNMANTASGRWSTFTDTMKGLVATITQPIFDTFSGGLGGLNDIITANMPTIQAFADTLAVNVKSAIDWLSTTGIPALVNGWNQVQPTIQPIIKLLGENLQPILAGIGLALTAIVVPAIVSAITAFAAVAAPIAAMIAVGAALYLAWQNNFLGIRDIVNTVITTVSSIITTVMSALQVFWSENGNTILSDTNTVWNTISEVITTLVNIIWGTIQTIFNTIVGFIRAHNTEITGILRGAWTMIQGIIQVATAIIKGVLATFLALLKGDWKGAWEAIQTMFKGVWEGIKTYLSGALEFITNLLKIAWEIITTKMRIAWDGLLTLLKIVLEEIKGAITTKIRESVSFIEGLASRWKDAGSALINNFFDGIKSRIDAVISFVRQKVDEIAAMLPGSEPRDKTSPLYGLKHRGAALIHNLQEGINSAALTIRPALDNIVGQINTAGNTTNRTTTINANYTTNQVSESFANDIKTLNALYGV